MIKKSISLMCVLVLLGVQCFGAALSAARNTPSKAGKRISLTVADTITIYAGAMVAVDGSAEAQNAADTSGYTVVGRARKTVDNTDDGETIEVDIGIFRWVNSGSFDDSNIGDICYVADNQSVTNGAGSNSIIAGTIVDVDSSGVWVRTSDLPVTAGSFTTLAASGAATLSSSLTVNGATDLNEDITIDLDASDEEIDIDQTSATGTASTPLISIDDDRTGATANEKTEATIAIDAEGTYGIAINDGALYVEGEFEVDGDVNNDATGGSTSDPDFDVDGYAKFNGVVEFDSALVPPYANKTANYTNAITDVVLSYNTSAATTNTLPEASTCLGRVFCIALQDDDGDLVVMTDGTDKFDGTNDILTFADAGDSCWLMATAANVYTILVNVGGTLSN